MRTALLAEVLRRAGPYAGRRDLVEDPRARDPERREPHAPQRRVRAERVCNNMDASQVSSETGKHDENEKAPSSYRRSGR